MWGYYHLTGVIAAGAVIAGFSTLAFSPVSREGMASSASIAAVAEVAYPLGAASQEGLPSSEPLFDATSPSIDGVSARPGEDYILVYSPSTELFIEVINEDRTTVPFRLMPENVNAMGFADKRGGLYRLEISPLAPHAPDHPNAPITITLIPDGI
jgi:hypothetical protein